MCRWPFRVRADRSKTEEGESMTTSDTSTLARTSSLGALLLVILAARELATSDGMLREQPLLLAVFICGAAALIVVWAISRRLARRDGFIRVTQHPRQQSATSRTMIAEQKRDRNRRRSASLPQSAKATFDRGRRMRAQCVLNVRDIRPSLRSEDDVGIQR
jgi:hypothetical protein